MLLFSTKVHLVMLIQKQQEGHWKNFIIQAKYAFNMNILNKSLPVVAIFSL
jgi:hypothetical protein